jgi:hypothetical protein
VTAIDVIDVFYAHPLSLMALQFKITQQLLSFIQVNQISQLRTNLTQVSAQTQTTITKVEATMEGLY